MRELGKGRVTSSDSLAVFLTTLLVGVAVIAFVVFMEQAQRRGGMGRSATAVKDEALHTAADLLVARGHEVLEANAVDVDRAKADRRTLVEKKAAYEAEPTLGLALSLASDSARAR